MSEDTQRQAPADYGPVSADVTEIPYPHPVSTFAFVLVRKRRSHGVHGREADRHRRTARPSCSCMASTSSAKPGRGTIDVLAREGFRVIVPDQIGFGRSSKPFIPYTFNDMAHQHAAPAAVARRRARGDRRALDGRHARVALRDGCIPPRRRTS